MIAKIKGKIDYEDDNFIVVDVNGIGYKVSVLSSLTKEYKEEETLSLFTFTYVREDILALYGFLTKEELDFFETLLGVSGIGPKMALNIMDKAPYEKIKDSILRQDPSLLSSVSGVGSKKAEKIVVELKGRIGVLENASIFKGISESEEVFDALKNLGYKTLEIQRVIPKISKEAISTEEKIKEALRLIS